MPILDRGHALALIVAAIVSSASASDFSTGAAIVVAADGPVVVTLLENRPVAFPDHYVVNALFKSAPTPGAPDGVSAYSTSGRENRIGDANSLPGMPSGGSYVPFKRGTALVFQLVPHFPRQRPAFGSVSTSDPDGLTAFVNPGLSAANSAGAIVRQAGAGTVEIAFPGPYGTPGSFDEYPVRVRISNATAR